MGKFVSKIPGYPETLNKCTFAKDTCVLYKVASIVDNSNASHYLFIKVL